MLVRSSPSALAFLNVVRATYDANQCASDQHCITVVVNSNAHGEANQTLWIPQWKINAYPEEIRCWEKANRSWERGLFMMHFAGAWAHVKDEDPVGFLMRKYEGEIIWS
jgi:mannan polymerase II complex MNN10 subunit